MKRFIINLICLLALFALGSGCAFAPTSTRTPVPTNIPATPIPSATVPPTVTPTNTPVTRDGFWDGSVNDGALLGSFQFIIENGKVTEIGLNYTLRNGGCTFISALSGTADESFIEGDRIHATMFVAGGNVLTFDGTFTDAKQAQGTLTYKGTLQDCGTFEKTAPWNARNVPFPPTETPTPVPPTDTPTLIPTATHTPLPTDSKPIPTQEAGEYDTEFPLPSDVRNFSKLGTYEGQINYQTGLRLNEIVAFYRRALAEQNVIEDARLTTIDDIGFSIVFSGWKPNRWLVIQGVDLGATRNVNLRLENAR